MSTLPHRQRETRVAAGNALRTYDGIMNELDVRLLPPGRKHTTIFERFEALPQGETLRIVNDHDPRPLRFELDHDYPNTFSWEYAQRGPEVWLVDITKTAPLSKRVLE